MSHDDADGRALARERIERLRSLADDLVALVDGRGPASVILNAAPRLERYRFVPQSTRCMAGIAEGHPELRDGLIVTSQVFAIDPDRQWVRTMSRFYRLGDPASELKQSIYGRRS